MTNVSSTHRQAWNKPEIRRISAGSAEAKDPNGAPDGGSDTGPNPRNFS